MQAVARADPGVVEMTGRVDDFPAVMPTGPMPLRATRWSAAPCRWTARCSAVSAGQFWARKARRSGCTGHPHAGGRHAGVAGRYLITSDRRRHDDGAATLERNVAAVSSVDRGDARCGRSSVRAPWKQPSRQTSLNRMRRSGLAGADPVSKISCQGDRPLPAGSAHRRRRGSRMHGRLERLFEQAAGALG